jgi:DNA polymerase III epsilon subunit-like protein
MSKVYNGMKHLYGNVLAAVDVETSGRRAGYHEIIQIAILPLDSDIRPLAGVRPFYTTVKPLYPTRADEKSTKVHGISIAELVLHALEPDRVQELLLEWFKSIDLPVGKCLVPLAHNWAFESSFLKAWLGVDLAGEIFHGNARDAMLHALSLNDRAVFRGQEPPFGFVGLKSLCKHFKVVNSRPHDALADCVAEAEVYRAMLTSNEF